MILETQQAAPNTGNFVLLVLAVWGAVVDGRYKARAGKKPPKWAAPRLAVAFGVLLITLWLARGLSGDSVAYLAGLFFVLGFFGYEAWRWSVRRSNPLQNFWLC
jgi:uncharacterized membrane protein